MDSKFHEQQPQQLRKLRVVLRRPNSAPTLSILCVLASDSDYVLMGRLRQCHLETFKDSWSSTILNFVMMRKLVLGYTTYMVPVSRTHRTFFRSPFSLWPG